MFLKICMGAQKPPPKLGSGGSGCKIQYEIFDFHAMSLDGMVIGAKALVLPQELDCFRPQAPRAPISILLLLLLNVITIINDN